MDKKKDLEYWRKYIVIAQIVLKIQTKEFF